MKTKLFLLALAIVAFCTSTKSFAQCNPVQTSGTWTFTNAACNSMTIRYNNKTTANGGASTKIIIFAKASGSCSFTPPSCNTAYTASTVFGSGTQIGTTGEYCVYISNTNITPGLPTPSINLTGLQPGTTYYFSAYAWCGATTGTSPNLTTVTGASCSANLNVFNVQPTAAACSSYTTTGTAIAPIIGADTVCAGSTLQLSDATPGGTWSSSNSAVATVNSSTGFVTGVDPGTTTVCYTATVGGCTGTQCTTITVDGKVVAPIVGASTMCEGTIQTLTDATSGGTWSLINGTGSATVSPSGVISNVSANGTGATGGTVTAKYSFPSNGCPASASFPITIYPNASISASSNTVCIGTPMQLIGTPSGGVWSITNGSSYATISQTGLLTGVAQGGPVTVTYTIGGTCWQAQDFNVYTTPGNTGPISGPSSICVGASATYFHPTSGGKWYITNGTGTADIDSSTGVLTGTTAGTVTINYSVVNGGCAGTVIKNIVINSTPTVSKIVGPTSYCTGPNPVFTNATLGGVWSTSNISIASINSSTGVLTVVSPGTVEIIYTVTVSGCSNADTLTFTYISGGTISDVTAGTLCSGNTRTLQFAGSGTLQWSLSTDNGTTYNAIPGATSSTYITQVLTYPTVYKYRVDIVNSCPSNTITLTPVNNTIVNAGADTTVCSGQCITLNPMPPTAVWSPPAPNNQVCPLITTTYTLKGASGSCTTTDTVTISIDPNCIAPPGGPGTESPD